MVFILLFIYIFRALIWTQKEFKKISKRKSIHTDKRDLPSVTFDDIESGRGYLNKNISNLNTKGSGLMFEPTDILFGKLRPYLKNILYAEFKGKAIGDFWVLKSIENSYFIYSLIQTPQFTYVSNLSSGSKMPRSDWNLVSSHKFMIPKMNEQKKIGLLIRKIEKTIKIQHHKLEILKELRKGLIQGLFPNHYSQKTNITISNNEKWNNDIADNLFSEVNDRNHPNTLILSTTQNGKVVTRESLGRDLVFSDSKLKNYKLVKPNEFIIHLRSFKGGFATSKLSGIVSPTYTIFEFKNPTNNSVDFWAILFTRHDFVESLKKVTEGIRYNGVAIKFSQFKQLKINYPDFQTQNSIASLINKLDKRIKFSKKKLSRFKQIKKFLLQNMFV